MPVAYDLETYPNFFSAAFSDIKSDNKIVFEISDRHDDSAIFAQYLHALQYHGVEMVGFNNVNFDYVIVHYFLTNYPKVTYADLWEQAQRIFMQSGFVQTIWDSDRLIPQIDLMKIHHFDNKAKLTRLKEIEINMRSANVIDLPFAPGTHLDDAAKDITLKYNLHDADETKAFAIHSEAKIEFRRYLSEKYNRNLMNHNDTKIGKDYFVRELEKTKPGSCYKRMNGKRQPVQTHRAQMNLNEIIFPYIKFERPEFEGIRQFLAGQTVTETNGVFKDLKTTVDGLTYVFGTGGLHASVNNQVIRADEDNLIIDVDVTSFYPSLAIVNRVYPAHLGDLFCDIYADVKQQRLSYAKKTPENEMLKLALNGVYGDSGQKFSPFYDLAYLLKITINGQLSLCMLAEQFIKIPGVSVIQANTDGLTLKCPKQYEPAFRQVMNWWQSVTGLELEDVNYDAMFVRDVNNYIARSVDGKVKRIGAYAYETARENPSTREVQWHKDHSMLVVKKAAEAALLNNVDPYDFILNHKDGFDFLLKVKVKRDSKLVLTDDNGNDREIQPVTRYYVAKNGYTMSRLSPPPTGHKDGEFKRRNGISDYEYLKITKEIPPGTWDERIHTKNKSVYGTRRDTFHSTGNYKVCECNSIKFFDPANLDLSFYVEETHKLIKMIA